MLAWLKADIPDLVFPDVEYLKMGFDECVRKSKYCTRLVDLDTNVIMKLN